MLPPERASGARRFVLLALLLVALPLPAAAADVVVRVESPSAALRSGPGAHHRLLGRARRGESFEVLGRDPYARWYRIRLEDGGAGFILGDEVTAHELPGPEGLLATVGKFFGELFGRADYGANEVEAALLGGVVSLDGRVEGAVGLRAAWLSGGRAGLEAGITEAPTENGSLRSATAAVLLQLAPGGAVVPYTSVGGGGAFASPVSDSPLGEPSVRPLAHVALGVKLALRPGILVRIEGRQDLVLGEQTLLPVPGLLAGVALHF